MPSAPSSKYMLATSSEDRFPECSQLKIENTWISDTMMISNSHQDHRQESRPREGQALKRKQMKKTNHFHPEYSV